MKPQEITVFQETVWDYYHQHGRAMPWRDDPSPYRVVVSEFMLQQTQVSRVIPKFEAFVGLWPGWKSLAGAPQVEVVGAWKGLGYNRRALWLQDMARRVMKDFGDQLPQEVATLESFKGVGPNTAGAIATYAYNQPVVFIETNIRRIFLHHFFEGDTGVHDRDLMPLVAQALDREHPREWYWALMDYGSYLATKVVNPNRRSAHHTRQSMFLGSHRQLRGLIIERLLNGSADRSVLLDAFAGFSPQQVLTAIDELTRDGFLFKTDTTVGMK